MLTAENTAIKWLTSYIKNVINFCFYGVFFLQPALSGTIFSEALADVNIFIEIDSLKANGQWTNLCVVAGDIITPGNSWQEEEWVSICRAKQINDVYEALRSEYGANGFQLKIVPDSAC